jgi:hypothetical protein
VLLRRFDRAVWDQNHALYMSLRDREHQSAHLFRRERIGRDATGFGIYWPPGTQGSGERWRLFGLNADETNRAGIPSGNSTNEPTPADSDQKRIQVRRLLRKFQADRPLTQQRFHLIECVNLHRSGVCGPSLARLQGVRVAFTRYHKIGAKLANPQHLRWRCHTWYKDTRRYSQALRRISHGDTVIATGCSDDAHRRDVPEQEIGESTASFE